MYLWCFQFPSKNEQKQVNRRFHSSKEKFIHSFFGGNVYLKKIITTFSDLKDFNPPIFFSAKHPRYIFEIVYEVDSEVSFDTTLEFQLCMTSKKPKV